MGNVISRLRSFYFSKAFVWVIFAFGVFFRLRQYFCNRSLWIDEAALAVSFVERSFLQLLLPLKYGQMAPLGFLMVEKLSVVLLGPSELALRFFPLVAGLAALILFYRVAQDLLEREAVPFALAMFAVHQPFVYFSSEVKPYILDVAILLALIGLTLRLLEKDPHSFRQVLAYGAAGAIAVWFSFSAIFVVASMTLIIAAHYYQNRQKRFAPVVAIVCFWFVSFVFSYLFVKPHLSTELDHHLQDYWKDSFMAVTPSLQSLKWYARTFLYTFYYPGGFVLFPLAALVSVAGVASFITQRKFVALAVVLGPIAATLLASAVHAYPFSDRLILFLVPLLLILVAEGVFSIKRYTDRWHKGIGLALLAVVIGFPAWAALDRAVEPITREEIRPVLEYFRANSQPTDVLYVYTGGIKAFDYYTLLRPVVQVPILGVKSRHDKRAYIQDLQQLEGKPRVWFLFVHDWPINENSEQKFILAYLERVGQRRDEFIVPARGAVGIYAQKSAVYLYDLSRPFH